jgi:hypothetical protein
MEIDTPGHTAMVAPAHPDYVACYAKTPWASYALQPPAGQIRFADPEVEDWTSHLMSAAAGLTSSAYFGTGGDEFNYNCMVGFQVSPQIDHMLMLEYLGLFSSRMNRLRDSWTRTVGH